MKRLLASLVAFFGLTLAANAQCAAGYTQLSNVFACQLNTGGAPVITSPSTASGTVGTAFSYQITATNSPTSFGASGLPSPLTVNTSAGLISGTPTAASTSTVVLGATNSSGTGNENLTLTIRSGGGGTTVFNDTLAGDGGSGARVGFRTIIPVSHLVAAPGTTKISVTLSVAAGTTAGSHFQAWVGEYAGTGDAWAFDGHQVQLTWSGSTTFTLAGGAQTFTSDPIAFTYSPSKILIISADNPTGSAETFATDTYSLTTYYKFGVAGGTNDPRMDGVAGNQTNPYAAKVTMQ